MTAKILKHSIQCDALVNLYSILEVLRTKYIINMLIAHFVLKHSVFSIYRIKVRSLLEALHADPVGPSKSKKFCFDLILKDAVDRIIFSIHETISKSIFNCQKGSI